MASASSSKQRVGVADYFAILGVGETLVWKHAQQKSSSSSATTTTTTTTTDDTTENSTSSTPAPSSATSLDIPEEDDAMLLQRFYREIVHCDIIMELQQKEQNQQQEELDDKKDIQIENTSDTTSLIELDGWTIIKKTRTTSQNGTNQPSLWNKGQVWDANLDIMDHNGIAAEIQKRYQTQNQQQQQQQLQNQTTTHKQGTVTNSKSSKYKTPLKDLRKRVQSTFQSRTQHCLPINPQDHVSNDQYPFQDRIYYNKPFKYYLKYKRRSPDELNIPAIADIALYYVQVHKATISIKEHQHQSTVPQKVAAAATTGTTESTTTVDTATSSNTSASPTRMRAMSLLEAGKQAVSNRWNTTASLSSSDQAHTDGRSNSHQIQFSDNDNCDDNLGPPIPLRSFLVDPPMDFEEWVIPHSMSFLRFPKHDPKNLHHYYHRRHRTNRSYPTTTVLYADHSNGTEDDPSFDNNSSSKSNKCQIDDHDRQEAYQGIEAVDKTPPRILNENDETYDRLDRQTMDLEENLRPRLLHPTDQLLLDSIIDLSKGRLNSPSCADNDDGERIVIGDDSFDSDCYDSSEYIYIPILAIRRQRTGNEERYLEDPGLIELSISYRDEQGLAVLPLEDMYSMSEEDLEDGDDDDDDDIGRRLLCKTKWRDCSYSMTNHRFGSEPKQMQQPGGSNVVGALCLIGRHNIPMGFCDAAFSTKVMDRFPYKNYKGLPLPEEELPMFCYPTGCRLHRAKYSDAPLPQYYGFVVKNERGDSIYVSCVSFMEPLTTRKKEQLLKLSERRRRVSLPNKKYWTHKMQRVQSDGHNDRHFSSSASVVSPLDWIHTNNENDGHFQDEDNSFLTAFDQMTTFENKTICLVSRYPYWTAFRRFLSHLHSISGSSSDLPLERYISHLLLSVPVPKPGGPNILIPLPTFNIPMMLSMPPQKDLPLFDLPFERILSCLDVPTVVTIVIGFLALEKKVIVMSSRPSLVLDVCECARALLFPFELVAPYVPRLTEPFMSCLDFPGAIFVGIHDDGTPDGLAATVRQDMPEDSTIVDLDTGNVDCSGDRMSALKNSWGIIPPGPRSSLISEIESLCRDASIVPGQEPLDSQLDAAFEASMPTALVEDTIPLSIEKKEPLDDRAIRDAFMRFFCSVLAGYERFLVVPDVDFLISGNEWFDAKGFLASASEEKAPFLGALVSTQLFQSFIQRRTEASDMHLLLFDECLQEYHASNVPYGRLGGDVETVHDKDSGKSQLLYSLLVDQAAADSHSIVRHDRSFDGDSKGIGSDTDNSSGYHMTKSLNSDVTDRLLRYSEFGINSSGDWVTLPSRKDILPDSCFIYCIDGNSTFPDHLNPTLYVPRHPESWLVEMSTASTPMLTRSNLEKDEAERRRKFSTSYRGLHNQRKCLWQLPKLMGSHFLATWLLCIPALVSQPGLSHDHQSKYLLRAFGALRMLRSKHKIVPDEAAYRALIVACGRTKNDRRSDLVKLFGLLRSDGIFPSAVTLGQYTRALAEGYSKRVIGSMNDEAGGVEVTAASDGVEIRKGDVRKSSQETRLCALDGNIQFLEDAGRRWRQRTAPEKGNGGDELNTGDNSERHKKRQHGKMWNPVVLSSSFVPSRGEKARCKSLPSEVNSEVQLVAMWSRTVACGECSYIPLDEEIQGGWDAIYGGEYDIHGAITCPRCGSLLTPKIAYKQMSLEEIVQVDDQQISLPSQIRPSIGEHDCLQVTYISPSSLRDGLEQAVDEHGEGILEREKLRELYPELFFNLWWFCARFQLPLPLAVSTDAVSDTRNYCAVAAWDYEVVIRGCHSCARVILETSSSDSFQDLAPSDSYESLGDFPLLSKLNLSAYYPNVWDHPDLSEILVALVKACDTRDFRAVLEAALRRNDRLDCYRTICFLARYQCTSAFHAFFPTTLKPCKGYHWWCPIAPVPVFDHLFREAAKRIRASDKSYIPIHEVSDVPLAFRSIFGHLL